MQSVGTFRFLHPRLEKPDWDAVMTVLRLPAHPLATTRVDDKHITRETVQKDIIKLVAYESWITGPNI